MKEQYEIRDLNINSVCVVLTDKIISDNINRRNKILKNYHIFFIKILKIYWIFCEKCNKLRAVSVHHINRNHKDNRIHNMMLLCKSCHMLLHNKNLNLSKRISFNKSGSYFTKKKWNE